MNNIVFLHSPMDALYLNVSIQSLFVVTLYSSPKIYIGLRKEDPPEVIGLVESLAPSIQALKTRGSLVNHMLELQKQIGMEDLIFLTPPGTIFLRESAFATVQHQFLENLDLGMIYTSSMILEDRKVSYPSLLGPIVVRGNLFKDADFSKIDDVGIGALLSHKVLERKLLVSEGSELGTYTYSSSIPSVLGEDVRSGWIKTLNYLKEIENGRSS